VFHSSGQRRQGGHGHSGSRVEQQLVAHNVHDHRGRDHDARQSSWYLGSVDTYVCMLYMLRLVAHAPLSVDRVDPEGGEGTSRLDQTMQPSAAASGGVDQHARSNSEIITS